MNGLERPTVVNMDPVTFAKRLREAREAAGKTQQDVADHCDISNRTVSAWEKGVTDGIIAANLFRVADFLGVSARWLTLGDESLDHDSLDLARRIDALPADKQEAVRRLIEALNR